MAEKIRREPSPEMKERIKNMGKAISLITEKEGKGKPKKDKRGTIICPVCGKNLHYTVSSYNGHIWGNCETDGCLGWMM